MKTIYKYTLTENKVYENIFSKVEGFDGFNFVGLSDKGNPLIEIKDNNLTVFNGYLMTTLSIT
jgi:hypothetical protein